MSSARSQFDFASFYHLLQAVDNLASPDLESLGTLGTTSDHETAGTSSTPPTTTAEQQWLVSEPPYSPKHSRPSTSRPHPYAKKSPTIYRLNTPLLNASSSTSRQPLGDLPGLVNPNRRPLGPSLVEKDTGKDVSHLLRTVEDDRFSTWLRLDDGSAGKVLGHWWCRTPQCDYHTNRKADMNGHVVRHARGSAKAFNCKTLVPGSPCRCSDDKGMSSDHRKSVKRHIMEEQKRGGHL